MFDFNSADGSHGTKMALKCTGGKVFDYHLSTCRKTFTVVPELSEFEKYEIMIWLQESSFAKYLWNISLVRFEIARNLDIEIEHLSDVSADVAAWTATIEFKIQIRHNETIPALGKFLEFVSPFNITIANHKFTIIKVTKRVLGCNNLHIFHCNEYTVSHDRKSVVHIKKTGEMFHLKDYYTNGTSANKSKAIFVCRRNWITECSGKWVSLENETIRILENKSIFVNNSKQTVYNQSEYVWQNGVILVCKDFPPPNSPSMKENDYALFILTSVSMFLSIIALLYFLVTYSIFAELRTLPGINLMNLSLSILLSQVLWLSGSGQTHSPVICATIAGLLHYLFLVSFVWTSIIAFDTWRAFRSSKGGRGLANSKKKKCLHCLRYMAVGWLSVMVYVVICVVLDLKNAVDIGYRSSQGCWISNPDKNLYFFGIPVSMILTLNFVFYVSTMRAIKATAEQAKLATNQSYNRQTLGVYIRIASAMGFTWIFGFIAPYGVYILWYPFVALNGLQGVYLALAFGLNQRVRNLYKNRYAWLNRETMDTDSLSMRRATTGLENISCEDKDDTNI